MSSTSELKTLRGRLSEIDPSDWAKVDAWIALATPLIRKRFSEHLADFQKVTATPQWSFVPRFSSGGDPWSGQPPRDNFAEAAALEQSTNQRRAEEAKVKILAFLDGLIGLSDVEEIETTEPMMPTTLRIFISHASVDRKLAKNLIDLIEAGLSVPTNVIRCTSVDGYKLEGGDDAPEVLRENLKSCAVVLGLLTKASIASSYVLMELGAAWAFKKRAIPLIGPGATFGDLPGPFKDIHSLKMEHRPDMSGLIKTLARETGLVETNNAPKVIAAIDALIETSTASGPPGVSPPAPFRA